MGMYFRQNDVTVGESIHEPVVELTEEGGSLVSSGRYPDDQTQCVSLLTEVEVFRYHLDNHSIPVMALSRLDLEQGADVSTGQQLQHSNVYYNGSHAVR